LINLPKHVLMKLYYLILLEKNCAFIPKRCQIFIISSNKLHDVTTSIIDIMLLKLIIHINII